MKHLKRVISISLFVILVAILLAGCERSARTVTSERDTSSRGGSTRETTAEKTETPNGNIVQRGGSTKEMTSEEVAEYLASRVVRVSTTNGYGSGFFTDGSGTVVTCYHVIEGADDITVELPDGATHNVTSVVDFSPAYDVAVLSIDITGNDYLQVSTEYKQGASVYTYGSPLNMDSSFTSGTLSSTSRMLGLADCIQVDAAINPGNSGGPVVNSKGEVLGICSSSRRNAQNTNFAVKMTMLDNLSMDKNYSINRYREWYNTETGRSYMGTADGTNFFYTYVNTFTQVTGKECLAHTDDLETIYSGYSIMYLFYYYDYDSASYDQYCDYLREIGFEYTESVREMGLEGKAYTDSYNNYSIFLFIDTVENSLLISCPIVE